MFLVKMDDTKLIMTLRQLDINTVAPGESLVSSTVDPQVPVRILDQRATRRLVPSQ